MLAIDTDVISNLTFTNPQVPKYVEVTMNAVNDTIYLCLVQDQSMSIPFVSAITVRPIDANQATGWYTYNTNPSELSAGFKFRTRKRLNFGGDPSTILRCDVWYLHLKLFFGSTLAPFKAHPSPTCLYQITKNLSPNLRKALLVMTEAYGDLGAPTTTYSRDFRVGFT